MYIVKLSNSLSPWWFLGTYSFPSPLTTPKDYESLSTPLPSEALPKLLLGMDSGIRIEEKTTFVAENLHHKRLLLKIKKGHCCELWTPLIIIYLIYQDKQMVNFFGGCEKRRKNTKTYIYQYVLTVVSPLLFTRGTNGSYCIILRMKKGKDFLSLLYTRKDGRSANKIRKSQFHKFADFQFYFDLWTSTNVAICWLAICKPYIFKNLRFANPIIFADLKLPQTAFFLANLWICHLRTGKFACPPLLVGDNCSRTMPIILLCRQNTKKNVQKRVE